MSILWCVSQKTNVRILRQAENRLVDRDAASELMKNYTLSFPVIEPSDGKRRVTARLGDRVLCSQETQFLAFSSVHLRQLRACSNAHPPPPAAPSCQVTVSLSPPFQVRSIPPSLAVARGGTAARGAREGVKCCCRRGAVWPRGVDGWRSNSRGRGGCRCCWGKGVLTRRCGNSACAFPRPRR